MIDENRKKQLDELLEFLNISTSDYDLLDLALTHSSYTFENKLSTLENNERLEFLGDAVLKIIVSKYLFNRFPGYREGDLTQIRSVLVSDRTLFQIADKFNFGDYIKMGFHEEKMGGKKRQSTIACGFEALLGALYFSAKPDELENMLIRLIEEEVTIIDESASKFNYKAILQEYTQAKYNSLPVYKVISEEGPEHEKTFEVHVKINDEIVGIGKGQSKKFAQQEAAKEALVKLGLTEGSSQNV
jgi:ribonuclease III